MLSVDVEFLSSGFGGELFKFSLQLKYLRVIKQLHECIKWMSVPSAYMFSKINFKLCSYAKDDIIYFKTRV